MSPKEAELMTQNFFEEHNLNFDGAYPVKEGNEMVLHIYVFGPKGRFLMKMKPDGTLYSQNSSRKKWIKIDEY